MSSRFLHDIEVSRAVRVFSPDHSVDINPILEAIRWAPTAWGIQPFIVHVVSGADIKKELFQTACNQSQIANCAHVLIFEARSDSKEVVEHYIKARGLDELERDFAGSIRCHFHGMSTEAFHQFATNQIHICLGYALAATDNLGMGACPLSGFDAKKVAAVLQAKARPGAQLGTVDSPVVMLALGSAAGDNSPVPSQGSKSKKPKVRLSKFRLSMDELCTYYVDQA